VLALVLALLCWQSLLGCRGSEWQVLNLDQYWPPSSPSVNDPLRVTCVDGTIYYGRMQPQSTREKLILESKKQDSSVLITIPLSQIRRIEFLVLPLD
jgi:hypothetical protein